MLVWDVIIVASVTLGESLAQLAWGHPFNLSALVGTGTGTLLAATFFAFIARSRIQDRAKRGSPPPSGHP